MGKFKKTLLLTISALVILPVSYWIYLSFSYFLSLNKQKTEWMNNVFKKNSICGTVESIEKGDGHRYIRIINGSEILSYGVEVCRQNQNMIDYISEGDSIIKKNNSFSIKIIKRSKKQMDFDSFFCQ